MPNDLEVRLTTGQSQSETENQISAFVYIVTRIFPLLATGAFASMTNFKKPESIALSAAMVSATGFPLLSDVLKLKGDLPKLLETVACLCMFAGVGMMDQGAIKEDNQSLRSIISLTAMGCFSLFAGINLVYNALKLAGCIQDRKPGVELASGSFGLVGSLLFLAGNTLGLLAQRDAGKSIDVPARMIAVASLFTLSTALHTILAGRAVCARKPEEDVLSEVGAAEERDDRSVADSMATRVDDNRNDEFLAAPHSKPVLPSSSVEMPGSDSPRGNALEDDNNSIQYDQNSPRL